MDGKQEGEFVQVDIVPTKSIEFQQWSQFAKQEVPEEKFVKTLVRNEIMQAVATLTEEVVETGLVNGQEGEQPVKWFSYRLSQDDDGLFKKVFFRPLLGGEKGRQGIHKSTPDSEMEFVTDNPNKICQILFGVSDAQQFLDWKQALDGARNVGTLDDPQKMEKFKSMLSTGLKRAIRRGNLPYMPPELEEMLGFGIEDVEPSKGLKKESTGIDTARTPMTKVHQLTGKRLRKFLKDFISGVDSSSLLVKTTPKIDGQAYRIAWLDGKVMMELSKTGLLDKEGVEANEWLKPYERNFYEYNERHNAKKVQGFLNSVGVNGVKVIGEILPNAEELADDNGTITYVGTSYDVSKLGKEGTMVMFEVKELTSSSVTELDKDIAEKVMAFLANEVSDKNVQFLELSKFAQSIELSASDFDPSILNALRSTDIDKMKREQAEGLRDSINAALMKVMQSKFKNPDIMPEGDKSLEGVVFELNDTKYGIHFDDWKELKKRYTGEMHEMDNLIKVFLSQITGGDEGQTVLNLINPIRQNPEKYQERYRELLPKFIQKSQELVQHSASRTDIPKFIGNLAKSKADNLTAKFNPELLTDDIMSFVEVLDGKSVDEEGKTIALIPGSFRPPHKGHFEMVKHYARIVDKVIVGISGQGNLSAKRFDKYGRSISQEVSQKMMELYCDAAGLTNVEVSIVQNPIKWVSSTLRHITNCKVMLGLSKKDDISRFEQFTDERFLSTTKGVEILPIEENAFEPAKMGDENISATYVRDNIDDKTALRKVLPDELNE